MPTGQWYYCLDHHAAEPYDGCRAATRLGPYQTAADAARALETVEQRNLEWQNDPRYRDPDDDRDEPPAGPFAV